MSLDRKYSFGVKIEPLFDGPLNLSNANSKKDFLNEPETPALRWEQNLEVCISQDTPSKNSKKDSSHHYYEGDSPFKPRMPRPRLSLEVTEIFFEDESQASPTKFNFKNESLLTEESQASPTNGQASPTNPHPTTDQSRSILPETYLEIPTTLISTITGVIKPAFYAPQNLNSSNNSFQLSPDPANNTLSEFHEETINDYHDLSKEPFLVVSMNNDLTDFSRPDFMGKGVKVERVTSEEFFYREKLEREGVIGRGPAEQGNQAQRIGPLSTERNKLVENFYKEEFSDELHFSWRKGHACIRGDTSENKYRENLGGGDDKFYGSPKKMPGVDNLERILPEGELNIEAYENLDNFKFHMGRILDDLKGSVGENNYEKFMESLQLSLDTYNVSHDKLLDFNKNLNKINKTVANKNNNLKKTLVTIQNEVAA